MTPPTRPRRGSFEATAVSGVRWLLGALILVSVALNVASVVARYVFMSPIFWIEPIIIYMMIWSVFLGAALVTWDDRHLNVDIVSATMPGPVRVVARVAAMVALVVTAALVVPQSWEATTLMIRNDQRTAVGDLPLAVPHAALLVGFVLILLAGLARIVVLVRDGVPPAGAPEPPAPVDGDPAASAIGRAAADREPRR